MAINDRELTHVVSDLQRLVGEPVTGAWQPRRDRVLIGLGDAHLLLVPRGPWARLHTVRQRPANPKRPFSFQGALRAHLRGRLLEIQKVPNDRVVCLRFDGDLRLELRLTGRSGGLWLLQGDTVLAAYDGPAPARLPELSPRPPRDDAPRFTPTGDDSWDEAARRWFTQAERSSRLTDLRARVARGLKRAHARALRLRENLEQDLERAAQAPSIRRQADTLAAHLHRVPRGRDQVSLPDLEDPGQAVWISLDPARSPAENMEQLYAKARRLDRVGDRVIERLDELETRIAQLRQAEAQVELADEEELLELEKLCPPDGRRPETSDPTRPWAVWTGPHGERVLVGRNAVGNRRLTFQHAKGDDFWLHVRSRPGAHVVVPARRDRPPPLELLLAAAQIALIQAKIPAGARADVQYTRIRHVRPIPGEVARVRVDNEKVLHVVRDPSALVGWTHD